MSGQRERNASPTSSRKPEDHALEFVGSLHQMRSQLLSPVKVPSGSLYLSLEYKISNRITKTGKRYLPCGANYTAMSGKNQRLQDQILGFSGFCWTCRNSVLSFIRLH